jgi:hypothetical protein
LADRATAAVSAGVGSAVESARLATWRFRVVAWGRAIETATLGLLMFLLRGGPPSVGRILPYFVVAAFMKTALRPSRLALEVDLLDKELPQRDASGALLLDDLGRPLPYKEHLLTFTSIIAFFNVAATLLGLLVGGRLMELAGGALWRVCAWDVATNVVFLIVFVLRCRPAQAANPPASVAGDSAVRGAIAHGLAGRVLVPFGQSLRDAFRFLAQPAQRPLLCLLAGGWMVEVATEFYDGKMIVKHVLGGTDDDVRHAQIAFSVVSLCILAALPALAARVPRLGRIFLVTMLLDGIVLAFAGRSAMAGGSGAILPFAGALAIDRALTDTSGALMTLAQNSVCRAGIRGRVAAAYGFVVLVSDLVAKGMATEAADAMGIPRMVVAIGLAQVALVAVVAGIGGRRLWEFGIRPAPRRDQAWS